MEIVGDAVEADGGSGGLQNYLRSEILQEVCGEQVEIGKV
jgi:hypothetical protein